MNIFDNEWIEMSEELKKQLEVIREQQLKIDEMKELIVKDFVEESERIESILVYANEIASLEGLIDGAKNSYYHAVAKPLRTTLLNIAKVTKLTATQYGKLIGDIPSSLTKELKKMDGMRRAHSTNVEADVFIGIMNNECTKFSISGNRAIQFGLDNFVVDYTKYKEHLEERKQFTVKERKRLMKRYNNDIKRYDGKILLLKNHKASE